MSRVTLIQVLLLLLAACLAFAWYVERQAHVQQSVEIESLQQAAARVQLERQAAKRKAAGELNRLDSDLKEFAWLVGTWRLVSGAAFVPDWHLPGRPRLVFESYDVFTVCGLSEIEIHPAFDGTLRINYSLYFLIENELIHLPIEETLGWDEESGFWKAAFAFKCYIGSLGSEIANEDYSAGGEYDLDQSGPSAWSGAIRYTDNHHHAPKPDSTLVLHRVDAETMRIELKDRQEEEFKNDPSRLRELDLTFKRVPE